MMIHHPIYLFMKEYAQYSHNVNHDALISKNIYFAYFNVIRLSLSNKNLFWMDCLKNTWVWPTQCFIYKIIFNVLWFYFINLTFHRCCSLTGLENNRPNLLLGLIIRQRPKRDFLPVDINETARFIPESKPGTATTTVTVNDKEVTREEEENSYISSLCASSTKERDREEIPLLNTAEEVVTAEQSSTDISEKAEDTEEGYQPLRFLPGVLRSWGGELLPLPDFSGKPKHKRPVLTWTPFAILKLCLFFF